MRFVDTNLFIRFLTQDDLKKAEACFELFKSAQSGSIKFETTETVIAEIVYILSSRRLYNLKRKEIVTRLMPILRIKGLKVANKRVILRALEFFDLYKLDFEDALLLAHMERVKVKELYSYDKGFDKVPGIKRLEP